VADPARAAKGLGTMELSQLLRQVPLFHGLGPEEMEQVAATGREQIYQRGDEIMTQGAPGEAMYIVHEGLVEVRVQEPGEAEPRTVIDLGPGQVVGEFALLDGGPRSATVLCATPQAILTAINREAFDELCQAYHHIGLVVYRNLAADVSFKLRHRHLPTAPATAPIQPASGEAIVCKVSVVVPGRDYQGAIISTTTLPAVGDQLQIGDQTFEVVEIRDLLPPRGEFHFMHATCKVVRGG
jgi:hypothetical protein